jgi:phage terminase Nu1 subunit (DNA packaging protein)
MQGDFMATTSQLAEILGVSGELVRLLSRQKILPKSSRNEYDLREAIPAFYRYQVGLSGGDDSSQYEIERTRYMKARADQAEMTAGLQAGKLGYVDDIQEAFSDEALHIRGEILSNLPRRLSLIAIPKEAREREVLYRKVCREALTAIATAGQSKKQEQQ